MVISSWSVLPKGACDVLYPWGECKPEFKGQLQKIYKIAHITHKRNMATIHANDHCYRFEPKQKYGKCGYEVTDGSPLGESYRCMCVLDHKTPKTGIQYTKVTKSCSYLMATMSGGTQAMSWAPCMGLKNSPQISSQHSVNLYSFIKIQMNQTLYLRVGGTLRYKKGICHVIAIRTDNGESNEIEKLPPLRNNAHFKLNGFLDAHSWVVNWETFLEFTSGQFEGGCKDNFTFSMTAKVLSILQLTSRKWNGLK